MLWLGFALPTAYKRQQALLEAYGGDAACLFTDAANGRLPAAGKREAAAYAELRQKANEAYIDACLEYLKKRRIAAVLPVDENYPALLKEIYRPPTVLYVRGTLPKNLPLPIAMIGSRHCSDYGTQVALRLSEQLSGQGACVVSGLAYGIDCACAQGALYAAGSAFPTVAVLGSGVDVIYPQENHKIYQEICERGAVVSEFLPGTRPLASHFPQRNRIISGMSRGVVVIEASLRSGTSITVDCALEQGRDVFALPGRVTDLMSEGTNKMIADGIAKPIFSAADILEEYGVRPRREAPAKQVDETGLSFEQTLVVRLLRVCERSFDELCEMTGLDVVKINYALTELEFSGIIKQSSGRVYSL
jgi:DNA processing protein